MNEQSDAITWTRTAERMSALTLIFACLSMLIWVLSLIRVQTAGVEISLNIFPAAAAAGVFYLLNAVLMERRTYLNLLLLLDAVLAAGSALLFYRSLTFEPAMPAARAGFTVLYVFCLIAALYVAWDPIRPQTVIGCFDWMAVLLILYPALQRLQVAQIPVQVTAMCAFTLALSFLTMMRLRLERTGASGPRVGDAGGGRLFMAALIVLIAGAAVLIGAAASGTLHGLSTLLWSAVTAAAAAVLWIIDGFYYLLELFAKWLTRFFSPEAYEAIETETGTMETVTSTGEAVSAQVPAWFYVLVILAAAVLILYFLYRIRHVRMEKTFSGTWHSEDGGVRRRSDLMEAIRRFLHGITDAVRFEILYLKKRGTPAGRLIRCERQYRRSCPRGAAESGEAYLRRLADDPVGAQRKAQLLELADQVERAFYARHRA